jgi:UrcA family protein
MSSNIKTAEHNILGYATAMALACVLVTFNAHAGDSRSETVKFSDLNLSSPAGVEALYGRIHLAAGRVCQQPGGELEAQRSCMTKAERNAIAKVNVPLLTAFYQNKTGTQPQTITAHR